MVKVGMVELEYACVTIKFWEFMNNEFLSILNRHKEFLRHPNMKSRILTIFKPFLVHRSQSEVKMKKKFYYERKHFSKLSIWQQDLYDSFINDYKTLKNSVKHSTNDKTKYLTLSD